MYQALYRKWRPQTFDQVVGQKHITETLKSQVRSGRLSHAYIFIGTRGTGKTTCARILARAVNCENPVDGNPCGCCAACRGILDGSVMDVVELDAASNNGVDNVRALREEAVFSPAAVKKRVYIIDEVHMLSMPAFNALLKILEEPPEHLMFILATTELQKVPATILSRCQRHSFRRIEAGEIANYLRSIASKEQFSLSDEAADLIARMADGGVRDALSLLDQCSASEKIDVDAVYSALGLAGNRRVAELLDRILAHDTAEALRLFTGMWMDGKDPSTLLNELSGLLREILMVRVAPRSAGELISGAYDGATLSGFAKRMTTEELLCAMETVQRSLSGLRTAGNPRTAAELCLVSLCDDTEGESLLQLRARISHLEEELARGIPEKPARTRFYEDEAFENEPEPRCVIDDEDDELDPEMFVEEQPEDIIVKREAPAPSAEAPKAEAPVAGGWKEICEAAKALLPIDLRVTLGDESRVRGSVEGAVLAIEVVPGFLYERFNRQDIQAKFAEAARTALGRELRVQLRELKEQAGPKRSLDELKQFKEVQFL